MKNKAGHIANQNDDGSYSIVGNENLRLSEEELDRLIALEGGRWLTFVHHDTPTRKNAKRVDFNDAR